MERKFRRQENKENQHKSFLDDPVRVEEKRIDGQREMNKSYKKNY
jgi:hypothetical protein